MKRRKPSPETEDYYASIQRLVWYFKIYNYPPFYLSEEHTTKVDNLIKRFEVPTELRTELYWIFGYVFIEYVIYFDRNKAKWEQERAIYTKPDVKEGIDLYFDISSLPYWEAVESITFKIKPEFALARTDEPEKSKKITYPEMIRFILEAIYEKRFSPDEIINKEPFFYDELKKLDTHTVDDEWYKDEVEMNKLLDPQWCQESNKQLKKYRRTKKSLSDYLSLGKKETIEDIYYYMKNEVGFVTQQKLCGFMAEFLYDAGMPFIQSKKYDHQSESREIIIEEVTAQIKSAIIAIKT